MSSPVPRHRPFGRLDPRRSAWRLVYGALGGAVAGWVASRGQPLPVALLVGWDVCGLVLLVLTWLTISRCDAARTHARAAAEDPGRTAVYVLVVLASAVSLLSATFLSRHARAIAPGEEVALVALCLLAVALAWLLTQTSFTMRYAHLYYRDQGAGVGGVKFPQEGEAEVKPAYLDFAYFAFTLGMCFQVSDCSVTSARIRRAVLVHAVLSFAYNTLILAFTLNLVFGVAA